MKKLLTLIVLGEVKVTSPTLTSNCGKTYYVLFFQYLFLQKGCANLFISYTTSNNDILMYILII
jgi:hypothetical protein